MLSTYRLATVFRPLLVLLSALLLATMPASDVFAQPEANSAGDRQSGVYHPQHRPAESLIKSLQPLYGDTARFSSDGQRLLIDTDRHTLDIIKDMLTKIDRPLRHFLVTLSEQPIAEGTRVYSTTSRNFRHQQYELLENQTLSLVRARQQQSVNQVSPWWVSTDTQTTQGEALALSLTAVDASVYISIDLQVLENDQYSTIRKTVNTELGQWVSLYSGSPQANSPQVTSTGSRSATDLYIRIVER